MTQTYREWAAEAKNIDKASGAAEWKSTEKSDLYDHSIIRRRYNELKDIRQSGDAQRLLFYYKEGIHGNMAGMGAPKLYGKARFGTKNLITDYVTELVLGLELLNESPEVTEAEKLSLFRRASMGFGRTALLLSGAGSLGAFHLGVIKVLHEQKLLPRVIAGASTGAFVAALMGTHSAESLNELLQSEKLIDLIAFQLPTSGRREVDLYDLETLLRNLVPDLTFEEAYEISGLHINISVAAQKTQQRSRLLNATTAPNALIREAVLASCAIPGRFPAVTLAARDQNGKRQPYIPSRSWVDGSITDEVPTKRLTRLYGINYFIGSNANPMLSMLPEVYAESPFGAWAKMQESITRQWLLSTYPYVLKQVKGSTTLNVLIRNWFSMVTQEYKADVNIMPRTKYPQPGSFFETLTNEETRSLFEEGETAAFPVLERLNVTTAVSRQLDRILLSRGQDSLLP